MARGGPVHGWGRALRAAALLGLAVTAAETAHAQASDPPWTGTPPPGWRDARELVLEGVMDEEGRFLPKALHLPEPPTPPAPQLLPIGAEMLVLLDAQAFGVEERVQLRRDSAGVRLTCAPGKRPAGAVLRWPGYRLPQGMRGTLALAGEGGGGFGLSPVRPGADAPALPATRFAAGEAALPLPDEPGQLVIACPDPGGALLLRSARIVAAPGTPGSYGSWVWDARTALAAPEAFATRLERGGLDEIAVQAPADAGRSLGGLATALRARRIAFRLVEGDPGMIDAAGLDHAVARVRQLRTAMRTADPETVLELDIEPYAAPGYAPDPAQAWRRWGAAVTALARTWGRPVDIVVPWWMLGRADAAAALAEAGEAVRGVVVMAYRTDPQLILAAAEPWLAWGDAQGKPVRIAIEAGPVAREVQRHYRRAPEGPLEIAGDVARLHGVSAAEGSGALRFALVRETVVDPRRVSFHGADAARAAAERQLLPILRAWPSFAGFRVHELALD